MGLALVLAHCLALRLFHSMSVLAVAASLSMPSKGKSGLHRLAPEDRPKSAKIGQDRPRSAKFSRTPSRIVNEWMPVEVIGEFGCNRAWCQAHAFTALATLFIKTFSMPTLQTTLFAWYNLLGYTATALGALTTGLPCLWLLVSQLLVWPLAFHCITALGGLITTG